MFLAAQICYSREARLRLSPNRRNLLGPSCTDPCPRSRLTCQTACSLYLCPVRCPNGRDGTGRTSKPPSHRHVCLQLLIVQKS